MGIVYAGCGLLAVDRNSEIVCENGERATKLTTTAARARSEVCVSLEQAVPSQAGHKQWRQARWPTMREKCARRSWQRWGRSGASFVDEIEFETNVFGLVLESTTRNTNLSHFVHLFAIDFSLCLTSCLLLFTLHLLCGLDYVLIIHTL